MATTTPNYGWAVPTSTDLVKDGATAIETLGDSIDASMFTALGTKKAGMVLLNTTSFSGVSSVSLPANTFSTNYTNYRILFEAKLASGSGNLGARMRASGTDTTSGNYMRQALIAANTSVSASRNNSATSWDNVLSFIDNVQGVANILEIRNPFQASANTTMVSLNAHNAASTSNEFWSLAFGINLTTQFDSMTFIPSASTMTGTVSVYGFNI